MASYKQGIDYFPFSVDFLRDRKFHKLRLTHGAIALMVYQSLIIMMFKDKGYYLFYNEKSKCDVIWEVMIDLQGKEQPKEDVIVKIIEELVECELFDVQQFKNGILTSKKIQRTFYRATAERRNINIDFSIWLLDEAQMRSISAKSVILEQYIRTISPQNQTNTDQNRTILKQSKEKKSKEEKRKENENDISSSFSFPSVFGHVNLTEQEFTELNQAYGEDMVKKAIALLDEYMEMSGKKYRNCCLAIKRWVIDAVKEKEAKGRGRIKKTSFHNFQEKPIDYDAVMKAITEKKQEANGT